LTAFYIDAASAASVFRRCRGIVVSEGVVVQLRGRGGAAVRELRSLYPWIF
jgi:hypothetical protein